MADTTDDKSDACMAIIYHQQEDGHVLAQNDHHPNAQHSSDHSLQDQITYMETLATTRFKLPTSRPNHRAQETVPTKDSESDAAQNFMDRLLNLGDVRERCGEVRSRDGACDQAST